MLAPVDCGMFELLLRGLLSSGRAVSIAEVNTLEAYDSPEAAVPSEGDASCSRVRLRGGGQVNALEGSSST